MKRLLALLCSVAIAVAPLQGLAEEGAVRSGDAACIPDCRAGFACHEGRCLPACNPPCPSGTICEENACVANATSSAPPGDTLELDTADDDATNTSGLGFIIPGWVLFGSGLLVGVGSLVVAAFVDLLCFDTGDGELSGNGCDNTGAVVTGVVGLGVAGVGLGLAVHGHSVRNASRQSSTEPRHRLLLRPVTIPGPNDRSLTGAGYGLGLAGTF